jgi:autotransporter passenger strand-loop-strand repeat protein
MENVDSGGMVISTTVNRGGGACVFSGVASSTTVNSGGYEVVDYNGVASSTTVNNGGYEMVGSRGVASGTTLNSGGTEFVYARGVTWGTIVNRGGKLVIKSGASARGTVLNGGAEIVSAGGTVAGAVTFAKNSIGGRLIVAATPGVALRVSGFANTDGIDLTGFAPKGARLSFQENAAKTSATLTIRDGALKATVMLFGQYVASGFKLSADGAGGTTITYTKTLASHQEIAIAHS